MTDEQLEQALRDAGRGHEPTPDWQRKVWRHINSPWRRVWRWLTSGWDHG